ncbi:hypothetical protein BDY24DRAFT_99161 [Mrakia frigida]|uniref:uncharacterized protein n=1 Tax=Mrakia frigida TaxID=29902 RepID=UPI003FCC08BA
MRSKEDLDALPGRNAGEERESVSKDWDGSFANAQEAKKSSPRAKEEEILLSDGERRRKLVGIRSSGTVELKERRIEKLENGGPFYEGGGRWMEDDESIDGDGRGGKRRAEGSEVGRVKPGWVQGKGRREEQKGDSVVGRERGGDLEAVRAIRVSQELICIERSEGEGVEDVPSTKRTRRLLLNQE